MITSAGYETSTTAPRTEAGVVVGVDGTPHAHAALAWAVDYARRTGSRVRAVAVWAPPVPSIAGPELGAGALMHTQVTDLSDDQMAAVAERSLEAAVAELPDGSGALVDFSVEPGDPAAVLLAAAEGAELLVLGNARHGALVSAVTASVAARCNHHATCPIVLVPAPPAD
ncbi:universal stress protein [Pseudonocardia sp. TRM90224]|uniref:universal stress protein n=1 Tax=Pseudonocardia sp. TRM90224 TaxID=2812678 RepID=UPI001E56D711|nr:universal stress protein [Pseudonocardia sp. TRM90224]